MVHIRTQREVNCVLILNMAYLGERKMENTLY